MSRSAALGCCIAVAVFGCGQVDDGNPRDLLSAGSAPTVGGSVGLGQGGAVGGSAGEAALGGKGPVSRAGSAAIGGAGTGSGGTRASGEAGVAGRIDTGGDFGEGGADGVDTVTVNANGLVIVTFTPASASTVVTVTLDSQCTGFAPGIVLAESTCANITLTGNVIGKSRVCFVLPEDPGLALVSCRVTSECSARELPRTQGGISRCCFSSVHDVSQPDRVCMSVDALGAVTYAQAIDSDGDRSLDFVDNCVHVPNISQNDIDHDGVGNECDNCESVPNPIQADSNHDGIGDACDPTNTAAAGAAGQSGAGTGG